jgi:lysophospholipase L1-like esterase
VLSLTVLLLAAARAEGPLREAPGAGPPAYLSLGDSLAAGSQPDENGEDGPTDQGYADAIGRRLTNVYPGLRTVRLSCGGARTGTLIEGRAGCQPKGEPSQLVRAERYMARHHNVPLVTVDIGDNDVEGCISVLPPSVDTACVQQGRERIARNLPLIARRLKAAAGPRTRVVGITDYNQFLALWNDGPAGRAVARRSVHIIGSLNTLMRDIYRREGIAVAEAGHRFASEDLTTMRTVPGLGRVPLAVERICRWTWACSDPPIGHDDHAKPAGYAVIAQAVLDQMSSP